MTYVPRRDNRFEYVWEAMAHIEDTQCALNCKFAVPGEYPMCMEISGKFLQEVPVEEVDDLGLQGLRCNKLEVE